MMSIIAMLFVIFIMKDPLVVRTQACSILYSLLRLGFFVRGETKHDDLSWLVCCVASRASRATVQLAALSTCSPGPAVAGRV